MHLRPLMLLNTRHDYVRSAPATHDEVMQALQSRNGTIIDMERLPDGSYIYGAEWLLVTLTDADEDGSYLAIPVKE